jgi:hypothetical protein
MAIPTPRHRDAHATATPSGRVDFAVLREGIALLFQHIAVPARGLRCAHGLDRDPHGRAWPSSGVRLAVSTRGHRTARTIAS